MKIPLILLGLAVSFNVAANYDVTIISEDTESIILTTTSVSVITGQESLYEVSETFEYVESIDSDRKWYHKLFNLSGTESVNTSSLKTGVFGSIKVSPASESKVYVEINHTHIELTRMHKENGITIPSTTTTAFHSPFLISVKDGHGCRQPVPGIKVCVTKT